jgi:hypothetical protein
MQRISRMSPFAHCPSALFLVTLACSGAAEDANEDVSVAPVSPADAEDSGISSQLVNGVWIFTHNEQAAADALLNGAVSISQGCLLVGGAVTVWPEAQLDVVVEYIEAVQAGESVELMLAGGDGAVPTAIAEKCQSPRIWFANWE